MDPKAFDKFPLLRGFFFDASYDGGDSEREPGCVILRAESQRWSATFKETTAAMQLYISGPTLGDVWKLVEAALGDDKAPWVKDSWQAQRQRGAGKKRS